MADRFTSIENQIKKLKSRGMIIPDEKKAKEILLDIGYYRLGFYWHPFEEKDSDKEHQFQKGTNFNTVLDLYYLDVDLRYLLIKYINRFELNFRTNLIYWSSMEYPENSIWYSDGTIMCSDYIKDLKRHYNKKFVEKNLQINKHHIKYPTDKYAPCWKTFEYYTFGSITKVYQSILDEKLKTKISKIYYVYAFSKFQNFLDTLVFVRNSCAHSGVIYDLHINEGIGELKTVKHGANKHNLNAAINILIYLIGQISINRKEDLVFSLNAIFSKYEDNQVIKNLISEKIGAKNL